jgi:Xaa-Pro aminopeptidase
MLPRVDRLRARLAEQNLSAALIHNPLNVGYLSGFSGSTAVLAITPAEAVFITDSRYAAQAREQCPGFTHAVTPSSGGYGEAVAAEVQRLGAQEWATEGDFLTVCQHEGLTKSLGEKVPGLALKPVADLVGMLRRVKDAEEIAATRAACAMADRTFAHVLTLLKPGIAEREIAAEMEFFMKREGSEGESFETIVASGHRSAMPHGRASEKLLAEGDFITFDFGGKIGGYCSDLTRTVVLGKATERQREVYGVVLEAQLAALAAIRAGMEGKAVDSVARDLITARGFGENFGHGLGHGLGRHVHDHPGLSQKSDLVLAPGMILTVEPGVYLDGWGGVRIEDDVVVTETGCEILTAAPKALIEVPV